MFLKKNKCYSGKNTALLVEVHVSQKVPYYDILVELHIGNCTALSKLYIIIVLINRCVTMYFLKFGVVIFHGLVQKYAWAFKQKTDVWYHSKTTLHLLECVWLES